MTTDTPPMPDVSGDVSTDLARDAHRGTSFSPNRRGEQERAAYAEHLAHVWALVHGWAETPEALALVPAEFDRYRAGYRRRFVAVLLAAGRTISPMITGPSNFPVARNRKRLDTHHRRVTELIGFKDRALAAMRKTLRPGDGPILMADPNAVAAIEEKLRRLRAEHEAKKDANKIVRTAATVAPDRKTVLYKNGYTAEILALDLECLGFDAKAAAEIATPDYMGNLGFPGYHLANGQKEITRLEGRLVQVRAMKAAEPVEVDYPGGIRVCEDPDAARVQIFYPGKPDPATIAKLKARGFRWAPSVGAWQRHLNAAGREAVRAVLGDPPAAETEAGGARCGCPVDAPEADPAKHPCPCGSHCPVCTPTEEVTPCPEK